MMRRMPVRAAVACVALTGAAGYPLDLAAVAHRYDGIGALSAGASSRALADYPEPQRSDILDYLFLPNFGAALQTLKVEIGGDSGSTDGTEPSHMRTPDPAAADYTRGYEWWLLREAKRRNPAIHISALPWAFPGWVGTDPATGAASGSPFAYPNQTAAYVTNWIDGARKAHNITVDSVGVWNERASSKAYVHSLRQALNTAGYSKVKIIAKDGGADICSDLAADPQYAADVDVVGLHYPSDYSDYGVCHGLGKPLWSSEESSSYDDSNGAACWARVINSHYVRSEMTSNIIWSLIGSMYHGTAWYGCGLLTAVEPWSGYYENLAVLWATAHTTQFTQIGWRYLQNGRGSGQLAEGGYYVAYTDEATGDFSMVIAKISHAHAQCIRPALPEEDVAPEAAEFVFADAAGAPASLGVWRSNYEDPAARARLFERVDDIAVVDGRFTISIALGDHITVSTLAAPRKGARTPPPSRPQFPLPYTNDFDTTATAGSPFAFSDQIGSFEVAVDAANASNKVLVQTVAALPIGWADPGTQGPVTLFGMKEFQDVSVAVSLRLPPGAAGCVATRANQMWTNAVALCVNATGYNVTYGGPRVAAGGQEPVVIASGAHDGVASTAWVRVKLRTVEGAADAWVGGTQVLGGGTIRGVDAGFAALGAGGWAAVEYDDLTVAQEGGRWSAPARCGVASAGAALTTRPCPTNGVTNDDVQFELTPNWQVRHVASGLCAEGDVAGGGVTLAACATGHPPQQFVNDYTSVRGLTVPLTLNTTHVAGVTLRGSLDAPNVFVSAATPVPSGHWAAWVYFPNTQQLRNQYDTDLALGNAMCLAAC